MKLTIDISEKGLPHREICGLCHRVSRIGFHVPNDIWESVVHASRINDIHCLECFTERADEKLIDWAKEIKFYPVSLVGHYKSPKEQLREEEGWLGEMKASILTQDKDKLKIRWSDEKLGYGELNIWWDENQGRYVLDAELMSIDTVLRIFKSALSKDTEKSGAGFQFIKITDEMLKDFDEFLKSKKR